MWNTDFINFSNKSNTSVFIFSFSQIIILNFFIIAWAVCLPRVWFFFHSCLRSWQGLCVYPAGLWIERKELRLVSCRRKAYKIHTCVLPLFILKTCRGWHYLGNSGGSRLLLGGCQFYGSLSWEQPWLWPELAPATFLGAQSQCEAEENVWAQLWFSVLYSVTESSHCRWGRRWSGGEKVELEASADRRSPADWLQVSLWGYVYRLVGPTDITVVV